ncbi:MAG: zinc ABC transporter substrate-binding protein [Candidatus Limnocylindrales bacterium]
MSSGRGGRASRLAPVLATFLLLAATGCGSGGGAPDGRIGVVAGENFYGDLVSRIGGDLVTVTSILSDPTVDPHTYESSPQNAQAVADAVLVVKNGLGYDAFLDKLLDASPRSDRKVIDVQALLGLPDGVNPHVWYDPATMPRMARAVADALEELAPNSKPAIEANLKTYLDSFAPLTAKIADLRARYPGTPVAYTEPVPGYLLDALGFVVLTPAGFARSIEAGTDPAPSDVAAQSDLLTGHKVKLLLYNSQATSPVTESVKTLAGQSGVPVVGVSETMPVGTGGFVDWQLAQLDAIESALGASR